MKFLDVLFSLIDSYLMGGIRRCNLFKTLYINFRCLPLKQAIYFPILCYGPMRFRLLAGKITLGNVHKGMLRIGLDSVGYRTKGTTTITLFPDSEWIIEGGIRICQGASVLVGNKAILTIKSGATLGDEAEIICKKRITIGAMVGVTWQCQITDFASHFVMDCKTGRVRTVFRDVVIGDYCWIGNRSTVQPGTYLPDHTIVGSNSLLNKDYIKMGIQPYSLIGGQPARLVKTDLTRIFNKQKEAELLSYFSKWETNKVDYVEISDPENFC